MEKADILSRARDYLAKETDTAFKAEVEKLMAADNLKELEDRFYRDLEFGTGGLRGLIGGGYNRMNSYVVRRATQGMCDYINATVQGKALSACVAYDSRHYSETFALDTALIFAANGIKAYLFSSLRPTPELSYAIRRLNADTGVVVTASHNPPAYNGYKAYWNDGAQVIAPHDTGIIERVGQVSAIKVMPQAEALAKGLLVMIDKEIDEPYVQMVKNQLFRPELFRRLAKDVKIVFTPLHGTGGMHFERVMGDLGLSITTVPEQREPDGDFPTVGYPNPEEAAALKLALELGRQVKADVVMATDPDADRLGIAVPDGQGDFALITGNQLGSLHADYILLSRQELGRMPKRPATIRSIVTTELQRRIAEGYGAECQECLTGFKWIADLMRRFEETGRDFVYGTEESYGYLVETEVRDKDGISAAAMTAEMTLYWRSRGKSLLQRLDDLYLEHGYHQEVGISKYFAGASGMDIMQGIMATYRKAQPKQLGGIAVQRIRDIKTGLTWETAKPGTTAKVVLPASDVIQWYLADGTLVTVRPSGTEPKIKFYILACTAVVDSKLPGAAQRLAAAKAASAVKVAAIEADIRQVIG
ncbi:MAG: phosphomannomutase [Spirochaetes bacterium GWD1_61_31]|nr:MAG: phosphomannomutase [Spirochaetes bacterium GWB1_60_80]OHD30163.1 MAG: phosphomannomutase [Spirochaetes bacterium GWC1_61_12]OHD39886.1 MAG: phosphomannomutase [Spirochaetes bacterium GWD1_61_31]OHD46397.1 MAG: phosphomannomutase [Spirochaetes bacterium GWE1_60_18]OHD59453.1 MAG: phosphomannomutase [Spirochaetes bacterium GWF1_60_12]HAP43556.1 phospho-sugar mutase [Spirochaetaceae bacterium]